MNLIEIFTILVIHWIADFILQTDWQAKNKSTSNTALTDHVLNYMIPWVILVCIVMNTFNFNWKIILFIPITFILHWVIDYFTSRINTKLWKSGKTHKFFVSIGFDQILHYIQLFLTYYLLKSF